MARIRVVDVKKGDLVHDMISGFSGTVTTKVENLHGTVEWVVESEQSAMTPTQAMTYSEKEVLRLKVLGNVLEGEKPEMPAIKRGDIVQDRYSRFTGTVTGRLEAMYGQVEWRVESEATPAMRSMTRVYSESELPRLVVVASAFDQERPIAPRKPKPPKKRHNRR